MRGEQSGVRQVSLPLWQRRDQLPSLSLPGAAAAVLLYCLLAALTSQCGWFAFLPAAVSGAIPASLFLLYRTPFALLSPLFAAAAVLLLARDGISAVLALFSVVLGFTGAAAVYGGKSRLWASVLGGLGCGVCGSVAGVVFLLCRGETVSNVPHLLRDSLDRTLTAMTLHLPDGTVLPVFSPEAVQTLLDMLMPLVPAVAGTLLFLMGYVCTASLRLILSVLDARADFLPDAWHLQPGKECAVVYCGAQLFLLLAICTPGAQGLYYASLNTSVLFMLPLSLAGFGALMRLPRTFRSMGGTAKAAVCCLGIMLLAAGIYWLFTAAAFYGVYLSFRRPSSDED